MPTNQELCDARGLAFDSASGYCIVNSRTEPGGWSYIDPATGTRVDAPIAGVIPDNIVWPKAVQQSQNPNINPVIVPQVAPAPATDFMTGAMNFLTAPSLFGLPTYVVIGAAIAGVFILMQMDGGGKKKGGGLF